MLIFAGFSLGAGFATAVSSSASWLLDAIAFTATATKGDGVFPYAELTAFAFVLMASAFMLRWIVNSQAQRLDTMSQLLAMNTAQLVSLEKLFLAHDLTVRGLVSIDGEVGERAQAALAIYREVQQSHKAVAEGLQQVQRDLARRRN